jgi:hypothetical protein
MVLLFVLSSGITAQGVEEIVELHLQRAKCLCGVVFYPNGDPVRIDKIKTLCRKYSSV